jgi:hypothetical protein
MAGSPVMAMIRWPLPYDHHPNRFEVVGRYIAQTIQMERFIDLILLEHGAKPRRLKRAKLAAKIKDLRSLVERADLGLDEWGDLPDLMTKVARNRNDFAHRMFDRAVLPPHYRQGIQYEELTEEELREQEKEAFVATELCRQLASRILHGPLNPGVHFGRTDPGWPPY